MKKLRIFLAGVGGQGTLTATNLLAQIALDKDIPVTSGEIHGMAQRGGIVESTLLLGGYLSPKISYGEADILLGFEPMETLRALPYLKPQSLILSNNEPLIPIGVSMGREKYPGLDFIQERCSQCTDNYAFLACKSLGQKAGTAQASNMVLLGALCASEMVEYSTQDLQEAVKKYLPKKIVDINLRAIQFGQDALDL
ncbi:MAG TPA: indolepyruvate oxidoreductase subunit beta [Desulfohalobiaceae bacterium]|nr:indolepyruvate oxidoreductase subunit beta [Desulfohalobiaceae bacterium]